MNIDINLIEKMIEEGYISKKKHPEKNLFIYNYTNKCTFDKKWNEATEICRGLILDSENNIVALPFRKFFNLYENEKTMPNNLPNESFEVYTKEDGSMIETYFDGDKICFATRGSFNSDQAIWANDYVKRKNINGFNKDYTYIFECIYKENRIVTDYGNFEGLILLSVYDFKNNRELSREEIKRESEILEIPLVKSHKFNNINEIIKEMENWNTLDEGFVIKFKNGFRVKIKSKKYLEVFKIIKGMTPLTIWNNMENGKVKKDFLEIVPEEFRDSLDIIVLELENQYEKTYNRFKNTVNNLPAFSSYKDCAIYLKNTFNKEDFNPLMNLYRGWSIEKIIMGKIKPKNNKLNSEI